MRQRWVLILLVAVTSFFTGGWLLQRGAASDGNVYQHARLFGGFIGVVLFAGTLVVVLMLLLVRST